MQNPTYKKGFFTSAPSAEAYLGDLRADGTIPLTANWPMGAFTLSQATWQGVAIAAAYGGTGQSSYAVGDLLYASTTSALSKLADVAVGQVLVSGGVGVAPAWSASPTLTGTLAANNLTATPTLSAEHLTNVAGWTATGNWTYGAGAWNHATGDATALTATGETAIAVGTKYEIIMTLTTSTAGGGVVVSLGGQSFSAVSTGAPTAHTFNVTAGSTAALALTPTAGTWVGSLTISVKIVTQGQINVEGITLDSGQLLLPHGNETYPSISFFNSTNTGVYLDSSSALPKMRFITAGVHRMFMDWNGVTIVSTALILGNGVQIITVAAGELQLGTDAATPIDQTFKACDGLGTDKVGAMLTLSGGQSTGAGNPGGFRVQTSTVAGTGATANTYYTRIHAVGKVYSLTNNSATNTFSVACADGNGVGGRIDYTVIVRDGTDVQTEAGVITFAAVNKVTETWVTDLDKGTFSQAVSASTLTVTWALDTATADTLKVTVNSNSGLTPTSTQLRYTITFNSPQTITIL